MKLKDFLQKSAVAFHEGPLQTRFPDATQMQQTYIICFGFVHHPRRT